MGVVNRDEFLFALHGRLRQFARYGLGRVLGTISDKSGKYKWFIDMAEAKLFMRAEINVISKILLDKGIVTQAEFVKRQEDEMQLAIADQAHYWPEVKPADDGRSFSLDVAGMQKRCAEEGWPE